MEGVGDEVVSEGGKKEGLGDTTLGGGLLREFKRVLKVVVDETNFVLLGWGGRGTRGTEVSTAAKGVVEDPGERRM